MEFHSDLFSRLKATVEGRVTTSAAPSANTVRVLTLGEALEEACPDAVERLKVYEGIIQPTITKLLRTPDVALLRMGSLSDRTAELRNERTPWLNWLETQPGGVVRVTDLQHRFDERSLGMDEAELFDLEDELPGESKSYMVTNSNTVTAIGSVASATLLAQELTQQQARVSLLAREIDDIIVRIRRKMNQILLANTEVKFENSGTVKQLGGFITRSTLNNTDCGGSDLTRNLLQGAVDDIANDGSPQGLSYNVRLMGLTNARQIGVLRDIIISEYGGIDPMSRIQYEALLMQRVQAARMRIDGVFEPTIGSGGVVPFFLDSQLPAGTTIIFDPDQPRVGKLFLMGQEGPYALQRPTDKLQTRTVVFDTVTLEDPLKSSRSVLQNHL